PARAIVNRYITEMNESGAEPLAFPLQYSLSGPLNAASRKRDSSDLMVMWAGQAAALARPLPAGELLTKLADEAQAVIAAM
ncbi:MAG: nitronate monooxygenase, partial [Alphaproteobacteria bacterium]